MHLPYYEIQHDGETLFANVTLKEFHKFDYDGERYVFNVSRLSPYKIAPELSEMIDAVYHFPGTIVSSEMMRRLQNIRLVESAQQSVDSEANSHVGNGRTDPGGIVHLSLLVSQQCNLDCVYCYGEGGEYGKKGLMDEVTGYGAVDWLLRNSNGHRHVNICFFGGEPLLNFPLIKKVVTYARSRCSEIGISVTFSITTNGTLLSDKSIAYLAEENIAVMVSFDGTEFIQNRQRPYKNGRSSYAIVRKNIEKLMIRYPELEVRATVYGDAEPKEIVDGIRTAGLRRWAIAKATPLPGSPENVTSEKSLSLRMVDFYRQDALETIASIKSRRQSFSAGHGVLYNVAAGNRRYYGCGVGKRTAAVGASGDIYPCHRFVGSEATRMGHVSDCGAASTEEYYAAAVYNLPDCSTCWARWLCGGWCFYDNWARTGDMHVPDRLSCDEMKAMLEGLLSGYCRLTEEDRQWLIETFDRTAVRPLRCDSAAGGGGEPSGR